MWIIMLLLLIIKLPARRCFPSTFRGPGGPPLLRSSSSSSLHAGGHEDTIFALSSGPITKTGVAVIRLSGPSSQYCLQKLIREGSPLPQPRRASLRKLYDPSTQEMLDSALILNMPAPQSFTGEDVVELHVHGSRAVIMGVFDALATLDTAAPGSSLASGRNGGIRPAERGEFTRRAFDNGRMDLTEVEGLADLLAADTALQRTQALRQMEGHLKTTYEAWRGDLVGCLAHTEAVIDFGDDDREDDISDASFDVLLPRIQTLVKTMRRHLADKGRGEMVREGVRVALVGPPNAGKSSLMNALARRPAAIVSPVAGTTRDVVEVRLDLGGIPCLVSDTAGLRGSGDIDAIELEGMRRARQAFADAQVRIVVTDSSDKTSIKDGEGMLSELLASELSESKMAKGKKTPPAERRNSGGDGFRLLRVFNKADLSSVSETDTMPTNDAPFRISCLTGAGLPQLEEAIEAAIRSLLADEEGDSSAARSDNPDRAEGVLITRARHRRHLQQCVDHLERFLGEGLPMDARAEEIRLAAMELGRITGRVDVEELLDIIFRDFCIGK